MMEEHHEEGTYQCVESFTEVAKSLIKSRKMTTLANQLHDSTKAVIDILNNREGVKVALPFWLTQLRPLK